MAAATGAPAEEQLLRRLRGDYEFFIDARDLRGRGAITIATKEGELVTLELKRPQRRLLRALMRQRAAGKPQRAIILKARQVGFSTIAQVVGIIRATQMPNHLALTVAQDRKTVAGLFKIGDRAYSHLPGALQPPVAQRSDALEVKYLVWGEPSRQLRELGVRGLDSSYETATAKTAAAARGRTIHTLHMSEVAFWGADHALLGIQNGVPDTPNSLILKESTANGHNFFKEEWDLAEAGESGYFPMFTPWFEEDEYRQAFANEREMLDFEQTIGRGTPARPEIGEDEEDLVKLISASIRGWTVEDAEWAAERGIEAPPAPTEDEIRLRVLEHLNWRRGAIPAKCQGKVAKFHQEYPSTPEEAFLSTGRKVFESMHVRAALTACNATDPAVPSAEHPGPGRGLLRGTEVRTLRVRQGATLEVPRSAIWVPAGKRERDEEANWRIFELPQEGRWVERDGGKVWEPPGQYIVSCDPASGEEDEQELEHADHAIVVINHATRAVCAEYTSQALPDVVGFEILKAARFFNDALVVVERTGGWGLPILRLLSMDCKYPRLYERETVDVRVEKRSDRLGWETSPVTKPVIVAQAEALLRDHPEILRSRRIVAQMLSYIRDQRGRMRPEAGKLADMLMAWMIAQHIASVRRLRPSKPGQMGAKASGGGRKFRSRHDR